jgi:hypothetical protein
LPKENPLIFIELNGKENGPVKRADAQIDVLDGTGNIHKFNAWLGVKITSMVGTMWCAYAFAALALVSLPNAINGGRATLIAWIAQTFLQLVLLSIIMVGQKVAGSAADARADQTYKDAEAILEECVQLQKHLESQDEVLLKLIEAQGPPPIPRSIHH